MKKIGWLGRWGGLSARHQGKEVITAQIIGQDVIFEYPVPKGHSEPRVGAILIDKEKGTIQILKEFKDGKPVFIDLPEAMR